MSFSGDTHTSHGQQLIGLLTGRLLSKTSLKVLRDMKGNCLVHYTRPHRLAPLAIPSDSMEHPDYVTFRGHPDHELETEEEEEFRVKYKGPVSLTIYKTFWSP